MKFKIFLTSLFVLVAGTIASAQIAGTIASAQTKTVWVSSNVSVNISRTINKTITFQILDKSGKELSKVSLSDADAKTNTLSNFFSGIKQAVNDLIAGDTTSDRGTLLTISVAPTGMTVAALGGNVTFTDSNGNVSTIDVGTGLVLNADGTQSTETLASLIAQEKESGTSGNNNSLTAALADAVKTVSERVAAGTDGNAGVAQLAALIKVVSAANPSEAASYVSTAVAAATSSTSGITDKVIPSTKRFENQVISRIVC